MSAAHTTPAGRKGRKATRKSDCQAADAKQLITIDGFSLWLTRKNVKNVNVRIKPPDGRIEVSMPRHAPLSRLEDFVRQHRTWIERTQQAVCDPVRQHAESATDEERQQWREIVEAFTPALLERWEPRLGVRSKKLVFREMRSRWGSCQPSTGRICINTRLALYPPECLEYVVVHELCHLLERGHGPAFKALLDHHLPDWRTRRKLLR